MHISTIFKILGIYMVRHKIRFGELHGNKKFRFVELHGKQQIHLMWLDGSEVNTLQECKLERPTKVAGVEPFGS